MPLPQKIFARIVLVAGLCLAGAGLLAQSPAPAPSAVEDGEPEMIYGEQGEFGEYRITESSHLQEQISCDESNCTKLFFSARRIADELPPLFEQGTTRILIDFGVSRPRLNDSELDPLRPYLREIAKRGGRVIVEPISIGVRSDQAITAPLAGDLIGVGYDIFERVYNYFRYAEMDHYHAKALTDPGSGRLLMLYFVHRNLGDPCTALYSRCDVIEYFDQEIFDQSLSRALREAAASGKSVQVSFAHTNATLPEATLNLNALQQMGASARLYKWLIAAGENETRELPPPGSRLLPLAAVVGAIKYSIQAYDLVKAVQLYLPARQMNAELYYRAGPEGKVVQSVVFSPRGAED